MDGNRRVLYGAAELLLASTQRFFGAGALSRRPHSFERFTRQLHFRLFPIARRVIAYFAAQAKPPADNLPHVSLTERESEVLLRVAKGFTLPEIGVQLGLSRHTIADYVKQIYRKLNVSSRAEAALEAQRLGLFRR